LTNFEKDFADEILRASGLSASKLGLRFDRVVVRVLGGLRAFAESAAPPGVTILLAISAPIRSPAKTADDAKREIGALLSAGTPGADRIATLQGASLRLRVIDHSSTRVGRLIGFVHNPDSASKPLLDIAEHWLRAQAP